MTGFVLILESERQRMNSRLTTPAQLHWDYFRTIFRVVFFELDQVGGDNGRFRSMPTKTSAVKSIVLASESAERVNPSPSLSGIIAWLKDQRWQNQVIIFGMELWTRNHRFKAESQVQPHLILLSTFTNNRQRARILYYSKFGMYV